MPIAIVGIGCRFPGGIVDPETFWQVLANGVDAITEIPADRFDITKYYDAKPGTRGRIMTKYGGFVNQPLEEFDAAFFGISRSYAERLDPQQRLLLETSWEAMEDAGLDIVGLRGSPTGIFVGQWVSDFEHRLFADTSGIDFQMAMGSGRYAAAGRLSYAFGFRGASLSIDAACSSGLASVHLAVRSLRNGDSEVALAGGVNMILQPHIHLAYSYSKMMAPDGRCRFGDAAGNGYVRAEGAGMVVLKRLDSALASGDRIYAVIRGSAVNNDGDSSGSMGRPSRIGQEELLRSALLDGHVHASQLDYVEAHGTGTKAGDPVELAALAAVAAEGRSPDAPRLWVGSVKTNFGHAEAAAGVAGLIKTSLMLQRGLIPPSLHFSEPNPAVKWAELPLAIPTALTPWPLRDGPRFAGVSSYGIGGTNAHVVLESAPDRPSGPAGDPVGGDLVVLPISARGDAALRAMALRYADRLTTVPAPSLPALCWSAARRRSALSHRAAFVAADHATLAASLRAFAAGEPAGAAGVSYDGSTRRLAFVFGGQGAQWPGMATALAAREPVFRRVLAELDASFQRVAGWSLLAALMEPEASSRVMETEVAQPAIFAVQVALAALWESWGIRPAAVVGHSIGELAAMHVAGVLARDDALRIVFHRGRLMQRATGNGRMAAVAMSESEGAALVQRAGPSLSLAAVNSPRSIVLSGTATALADALSELRTRGVESRELPVTCAFHSSQMAPFVDELIASIGPITTRPGHASVYSTVTGARLDPASVDADYFARNMRQTVQFAPAVDALLSAGVDALLELSPHPVLAGALAECVDARNTSVPALASMRRQQDERETLLRACGGLFVAGIVPDWGAVMAPPSAPVDLPLYPWQRERQWIDAANLVDAGDRPAHRTALGREARKTLHTFIWRDAPMGPCPGAARRSVWLVVGGAGWGAEELVRALNAGGASVRHVASLPDAADAIGRWTSTDAPTGIVVWPSVEPSQAYLPVATLRALSRAADEASLQAIPRVWWVTQGAHAVAGEAPAADCAQGAALWGAARVLGEEQPAWWGGLVDLPAGHVGAEDADALAAHLGSVDGEDQVAIRTGRRHALRLVPAGAAGSGPLGWRADAAYLITGGFGGLALRIAESMVRSGARRLILAGRTPLPPRTAWSTLDPASAAARRVAGVRALERLGAAVHLMHVDVADETALREAVGAYDSEGWPPIAGVIHTAAVIDSALSDDMTRERFARVLHPKLTGAEVLDRVFPQLDLFVLFSSISAYWAPAGMTNYAAANAGCDAVAVARRARGAHAISLQWPTWKGVGLSDDGVMQRNVDEMATFGVGTISPEEGEAYFAAALNRPEAVLAILPIDWNVFSRARRGRSFALFRAIPEAAPPAGEVTTTGAFLQALAEASPADRRTQLEGVVRGIVAGVLRRPSTQLDARQTFGTLGMDSLMAVEIRNRIELALERPLSATVVWNYPTVDAMAAHLDSLIAPVERETVAPQLALTPVVGDDTATTLAEIASLSDGDALRALRGAR